MTSVLKTSTNWADHDDQDYSAMPEVKSMPDGTKIIVEYRTNNDGKKVKVTRRVQKQMIGTTTNPNVIERKSLAKFGAEKNHGSGPHSSTTSFGDPVFLRLQQLYRDSVAEEEENARKKLLSTSRIKCRLCGGAHFTNACPNSDIEQLNSLLNPESKVDGDKGGRAGPGKWVAPSVQKAMAAHHRGAMPEREELPTIKVSNLSSEATEQDLGDLMSMVGRVLRVNIPKRKTGEPRGFAYVSFESRASMEAALAKFQGYKYDHLVLHLEVAERKQQPQQQ